MAQSPAHTLGEIIGNFFEEVMKSPIRKLCMKYNVYFDTIGPRTARPTKKITWQDVNGSKHDLDYVIERNGSDDVIGTPVAFIELAWRRYTKHSKNKVQEIAGAVLPIAEKYKEFAPFKGAILSGVFTETSLKQLENQGFNILYIPFEKVVDSFKKFNIDIFFDEDTDEVELERIVKAWPTGKALEDIKQYFIATNAANINTFVLALEASLKRQIYYIYILPLHGKEQRFMDVHQAIVYLTNYSEMPEDAIIDRYVIGISYNDGSLVNCMFKDKAIAVDFLRKNCPDKH